MIVETAESRLLRLAGSGETNRQNYIQNWLCEIGIENVEASYQTPEGPTDLYLPNRQIIVEVKKAGRLRNGPKRAGTGSRHGESAYRQLERYVLAERKQERLHSDDVSDRTWLGIVTDVSRWWVWEWPSSGQGSRENPVWQGALLTKHNVRQLARLFDREVGREWIPADPTHLFRDVLKSLAKLYERRRDLPSTVTQQGLWLEQLKAGGNAPEPDYQDEMFVIHTMLILISRLVSSSTGINGHIVEGFVQWVPVDGPEMATLKGVVDTYDWRRRTGDVLRALYGGFIPERHRKVYGEYYTPDWLAEKLCGDVIDDAYIAKQIKLHQAGQQVHGILDPACGSGTFLYHAAKRILDSGAMERSYMEPHEKAGFVCAMIHGMDIHPVAVEMAKANMHRLLPRVPDDYIRVYQGDALLIRRPESRLHSNGNDLALYSPGGRPLILPKQFLTDMSNINKFVKSAADDASLPPTLGMNLPADGMEQLRTAHGQLRTIIRNESNGVWAWYIRNQAAPLLLRDRKVGRIVSNPPWVRVNRIRDHTRREEIIGMARERGLWVGGNVSTSFDVAALFVDRCTALYLVESYRSAWVLPHGAMYGDAWDRLRQKIEDRISGMWNLKRLPFPNTPTCVMFFGVKTLNRDLFKTPGTKLHHNDSWKTVEAGTEWRALPPAFPKSASGWLNEKSRPIPKEGATLVPYCLVRVDPDYISVKEREVEFRTRPSMHPPWNKLGSQHGMVPSKWVRECLFFDDLLPYMIPTTTRCILPISGDGWDPDREANLFWRDATTLYKANCGSGSSTPKTLEDQLDFSRKLFSQFGRTGNCVLYNTSGDVLHSARIKYGHVIDAKLFAVPCRSIAEARYLTAILNADVMLPAFRASRQSDRDFMSHMWRKVPIPRYDKTDAIHHTLAKLAARAERVARGAYTPEYGKQKMRNVIREALRGNGVAAKIDDACRQLLPHHT